MPQWSESESYWSLLDADQHELVRVSKNPAENLDLRSGPPLPGKLVTFATVEAAKAAYELKHKDD